MSRPMSTFAMGTSGWGIPSPSPRATLDENIVRYELTEPERAEMEARRREIYEMLYPLSKRGVVSNVRRGAQSKVNEVESGDVDQRETISLRYESGTLKHEIETQPTYIQYAAEQQGVTDRTIKNRLRIAERLHTEVRDYVRGTPLADDRRGLLRLTRLEDPELQLLAARLIVEEGVPPRPAVERAQRVAARGEVPALEGHPGHVLRER